MKYFFVLILFIFFSCTNSDDSLESNSLIQDPCRLTKLATAPFIYENFAQEDYMNAEINTEIVELEYNDSEKISKIIGGPTRIASASSFYSWTFTTMPEFNISYQDNTVIIDSHLETQNGENTNQFTIIDGRVITRTIIETYDYIAYQITEYSYEYNDNSIIEYKGNELNRTFYFENGNLVKVEKLVFANLDNPFGEPNTLIGKYDIEFSDFDDTVNLMKGLYFIFGGFYKGFSENNYHKISFVTYQYIDGEFISNGSDFGRFFNYALNEDGTNGMFERLCEE